MLPDQSIVDLGNQGALYRFPLDIGNGRGFFTVASLPRRSFSARIVNHPDRAGAFTAVREVGHMPDVRVAINGGNFNAAFAPEGLLTIDHKTIGVKRADWIGFMTIDDEGNLAVTTSPKLSQARDALQGYPMIVHPGAKMGIVREDGQRQRRTVIAQSGDIILAIVTSPMSLFELGYALLEHTQSFYVNRIDAALNLSGGATTSFYASPPNGAPVYVPAAWPNREVLAFSPRHIS